MKGARCWRAFARVNFLSGCVLYMVWFPLWDLVSLTKHSGPRYLTERKQCRQGGVRVARIDFEGHPSSRAGVCRSRWDCVVRGAGHWERCRTDNLAKDGGKKKNQQKSSI
ncbi:hypothetical protein B0J18DRAFT_440972 [Chaetomium sp. MPI-SDFR-AT-0129]|nr:hypothetical protein B0J18DRAFT_440972 [Chaetomium sp. MPI-SDFR-AT-0129]